MSMFTNTVYIYIYIHMYMYIYIYIHQDIIHVSAERAARPRVPETRDDITTSRLELDDFL